MTPVSPTPGSPAPVSPAPVSPHALHLRDYHLPAVREYILLQTWQEITNKNSAAEIQNAAEEAGYKLLALARPLPPTQTDARIHLATTAAALWWMGGSNHTAFYAVENIIATCDDIGITPPVLARLISEAIKLGTAGSAFRDCLEIAAGQISRDYEVWSRSNA